MTHVLHDDLPSALDFNPIACVLSAIVSTRHNGHALVRTVNAALSSGEVPKEPVRRALVHLCVAAAEAQQAGLFRELKRRPTETLAEVLRLAAEQGAADVHDEP